MKIDYLSFPELPDGYAWQHENIGFPLDVSRLQHYADVDIVRLDNDIYKERLVT